jgi:hypothetical protein
MTLMFRGVKDRRIGVERVKYGRRNFQFLILLGTSKYVRVLQYESFFLESPRTATRLRVCLVYDHNLPRCKLVTA